MSELPTLGKKAPTFHLPVSTGGKLKLSAFAGEKNVVLYFYPRDNTPGCTTEACDFRDNLEALNSSETVVIGVSPDSIASHEKFSQRHELTFPLIADEDHALAEKYGVWGEKKNYGKTYMGITRSTFLIGKDGKLKAVWRNVKVKGHVAAVLAKIEELKSEA